MTSSFASYASGDATGGSGRAGRRNVLLGMHFLHQNVDCNARGRDPVDIAPSFWDYVEHMPEDLAHISYADFWHWWYEFERYKGDEKGLCEFDRIVDECLARGIKVKVDLAWSTWWTDDKDWESHSSMATGPVDVDDWVHLCDLLGRRYRGRVALWLLQGEANDLANYWQDAPIEHVHQVYRLGSLAFKRVDPAVMISIAGASPSVPREALDEWVRSNAAACPGLFDDVSMNYFGDIADPYGGLLKYYNSIRGILDGLGEHEVEIGSGESSFQWAESSYNLPHNPPTSMEGFDPKETPLCELKQAWRCNESLGTFFDSGGNKFVMWGTEYAPGGGWAWRWGLRKYQDWWGLWPESHRIPGTNIVYRYDNPDGRTVDLRPGWTSRETDPYHPIWHVYRFWASATPPGAEAVRLDAAATGSGPPILRIATYLRTRDLCVALVQNDQPDVVRLRIDVSPTGWAEGSNVEARIRNESIDYATGETTGGLSDTVELQIAGGSVDLHLPEVAGFTRVEIRRRDPDLNAEYLGYAATGPAVIGTPTELVVTLRNTGRLKWPASEVSLAFVEDECAQPNEWRLSADVEPGDTAAVILQMPPADSPGRLTGFVRLRHGDGTWFGPAFAVSAQVSDPGCPRKLVAFRELGHVRVKWFAPECRSGVGRYELHRAPGLDRPFELLAEVDGTEFIDCDVEPDTAYYYRVVAVSANGAKSRPSNEDNAKAISKPRIWDAEIVGHTVPSRVRLGDSCEAAITIRNTGSKAWSLGPSESGSRVFLSPTALWGTHDEALLPRVYLAGSGTLSPGESVTVTVPYVGPIEGRFENHWVMTLEAPGRPLVYFGTPLLVETEVDAG